MKLPKGTLASSEHEALLVSSLHKDWWVYQYTNRHFKTRYLKNHTEAERVDLTFRWLSQTYELQTRRRTPADEQGVNDILKFTSAILYEHHKRKYSGEYIDVYLEIVTREQNFPLTSIPPSDHFHVEHLHDISARFGFVALLLDARPESDSSWDLFVNKSLNSSCLKNIQCFCFPKIGDFPRGTQISTVHEPFEPDTTWDLAIYYQHAEPLSRMEKEIANVWKLNGRQECGDKEGYFVALYIDRTMCSRSFVINLLRTQVKWSLMFDISRISTTSEPEVIERAKKVEGDKRLEDFETTLLDAIKFSEGLYEKQKDLNKDSTRRAVALCLWDQLNLPLSSAKSEVNLIKDMISKLEKEAPIVLNSYRSGYANFGGTLEPYETVVREMRRDIALTDYCINDASFVTSNQYKKEIARKSGG